MTDKYDDIINLPHHTSKTRPHMSMADRAAQFSPFAALAGYEDSVIEAARLTDERRELADDLIDELDRKLFQLANKAHRDSAVTITYFVPDNKKSGGAYIQTIGKIKRIIDFEKSVEMEDGLKIQIKDVAGIEW